MSFLVLLQEHANLAFRSREIQLLLILNVKDQLLYINVVWKTPLLSTHGKKSCLMQLTWMMEPLQLI